MYHHDPLMYGGTAEGVDLLLRAHHELWSEIVERQEEFQKVLREVHEEEDCQAAGFPTRYLWDHPSANQNEIAAYVTLQWRKVSDQLGVPIPHEKLQREFEQFRARRRNIESSPSVQ
jgi:hypothetical protein